VTGVFDGIGLTRPLWPHQVRALAALDRDVARGDRATYLVVPPGGGKTLIGLEAARRLGRPTVVLCPNTAIQAQWMAQWQASFGPDVVPATASRELPTPLTVLTYQALCTLGAAGNGEEAAVRVQGPRPRLSTEGVLSLLHPNGRALIARLQAGGPWTLVLDECHHLLELWGRLLQAVIEQLGQPRIVGLTATPPHLMTAEQAVLHRALFGAVDLEVSAPALVREGLLAPYQELAFLTRPSPAEADYIGGSSLRFAELRAGLLDPGFASVPFLGWLQARIVERRSSEGAQVSWSRFEKDEPALADAAVRLHVAGLLDLPEGARGRSSATTPSGAAVDPGGRPPGPPDHGGLPAPRTPRPGPGCEPASPRSTGCWPGRRARPGPRSRSWRPNPPSSGPGCARWCCATSRTPAGWCLPTWPTCCGPAAAGPGWCWRRCWPTRKRPHWTRC